ncbi:MAG: hypothetical protein DHS20C05_09290 [Hyphococcus sp.]|nr:MAG: hypothetical protein DHS20C05_09290 [Marinicaulis sp.]
MAKSALEKFRSSKDPYIIVLDKDMPWATKGQKMVISSPIEVDAMIRRVPKGKIVRFDDLRTAIAKKHKAHITCPLTAGIFLNIASAAAEEAKAAGEKKTLAWWRALKSGDELNPKAPGGEAAHRERLEAEGVAVGPKPRGKKLIVTDAEKRAVAVSSLI